MLLLLHADAARGRHELRGVDVDGRRFARGAAADEDVHLVLGGELAVEVDALALQVGHGFAASPRGCRRPPAQGGRLLDCRVLGEHEQGRAGRRAFRYPTRDLVPPGFERGGLSDRVLRGGDLDGVAGGHSSRSNPVLSAPKASSSRTAWRGRSLPPGRCPSSGSWRRCPRGGIAALPPKVVERAVVLRLQRVVVGAHDAAEGRVVKPPSFLACASRWSKNALPRPCPRCGLSRTDSPQ